MSEETRPKLKLSFSRPTFNSQPVVQTPVPQSALRTPSLKLFVKKDPSASSPASAPSSGSKPTKKSAVPNRDIRKIAKKRKRPDKDPDSDDELHRPQLFRKLTLKTRAPGPTFTPTLKIKHKGKIPKRPLGVGYDSELSDREADPTLLEAFILRMPPGPDCDYLRDAINRGTLGVHRSQGGADVQLKFFDKHGRRAMVSIQQRKYAASLVDLPCIIEGMKSWDKKSWVKSADICQMLLVLGRVPTEEEAQIYPLPAEVNHKTFEYAHGLTPPMRYVRRRRFAGTKRTKVTDIEAIERRVHQLLQDDEEALYVRHEVIDQVPEVDSRNESADYDSDYDEDEDADGEETDERTPDDYFAAQNGTHGEMVDTPTYAETTDDDVDEEEVDIFEKALAEQDDDDEDLPHTVDEEARPNLSGLQLPEGDSSFAITSTSASPSATAAQTPATAAGESSDEDEEDEDDDAQSSHSIDDPDKEGNENLQQVRDKIQEIEEKIREQTQQMKSQSNAILQRKILQKINALKGDVEQMRNTAGLREDDD